ncbi:MAG: polysaccharide biosynthesis C-terminal domain-containing protein, partial [Candidatus Zixiibacteriota bacterium]
NYSVIGLTTIGLTLLLSSFVVDFFNIPSELLPPARLALIIIGANVAFNFVMLSWSDSLQAFHRYDVMNGLHIVEDILRTITIVYLLLEGYGIVAMALTFLVFSMMRQFTGAALLKKLHPALRINRRFISAAAARMIFNYSLIGFLISIAWLLIANTDNILIGYFFDTTAVTKYAIAGSIIVYFRNVILAVTFPLRPLISHYDALEKKDKITYIYARGTRYLYYITFAVAGVTLVFADSFIRLWLGPGYGETAHVLKLLVLPAAVFLPQAVANSVLYGIEEHRHILYIIIAEGLLNLLLSIILLQYYGIYGVAYGTIIPQVLLYLFVLPRIIKSILGIRLTDFYLSLIKSIFLALIVSLPLSYLADRVAPPTTWAYFFGDIIFIALLALAGAYLIAGRDDLRIILSGLFRKRA